MAEFNLPGAADRTVIIGQTGSGKTVLGAYLLSKQNFQARPWVCLDFKGEELWDMVGEPPMKRLPIGKMPGKVGLYRMRVLPNQNEALEKWLWDIWARAEGGHGCGIFVDEVSLMPQKAAFKAILRQGRSLRIPVIACTQRPVDCDREVFSESQYGAFFGLRDARDYPVIRGLFGDRDMRDEARGLKGHWSLWYDARQDALMTLKPCPPPATVAHDLRAAVPRVSIFGG